MNGLPVLIIVYLNTVIQIKDDPLVSVVAQFFIKGLEFGLLFDELVPSPLIFLRWAVEAPAKENSSSSIIIILY